MRDAAIETEPLQITNEDLIELYSPEKIEISPSRTPTTAPEQMKPA
jgi:hypothetical protein